MNKKLINLKNLEGSLLLLKTEEAKYKESINIIDQEVFFLKDQLLNYQIVLNLLRDENEAKMPEI